MGSITRRLLLKRLAGTAAVAAPVVFTGRRASAQLPSLPNLPASDALLLRPGDAQFSAYQTSFNIRTTLTPQLRALCKTTKAVGVMVDWCRSNSLPFALRSGGHSYEGFSQSTSVVIDTRLMNSVVVDTKTNSAHVGAGTSLGTFYKAIAPHGLAFPGGSCPTVGVSGHALGGGYGYLARPVGLACDSIVSLDLIDPNGQPVHADAQQNADLFWACRGGGGGSFGAVTGFSFRLLPLTTVFTFDIDWVALSTQRAAAIMKDWQEWAPQAPKSIDSNLVISRSASGGISLRCAGMSIGTRAQLQHELAPFSAKPPIVQRSYIEAINHFSGGWSYETEIMKGKSDYAAVPLSDTGLATLMNQVSTRTGVYVICDSYGGAIAGPAVDATAFANRKALYCFQYGNSWSSPGDTPARLDSMRQFYAAMRPYVSGAAYVNYCDRDLADWPGAYWGPNLPRLKQIKSAFDPDNVFKHAQSVPLA